MTNAIIIALIVLTIGWVVCLYVDRHEKRDNK
jgi:hypothetical protein